MRWAGMFVSLAIGVALTGCGGGGQSSIATRVLANNELPGFSGVPSVEQGAKAWLTKSQTPADQMSSQLARLNRLGFVAAVSDNLTGPTGLPGLSIVEEFRSPAGARSEFAYESEGNQASFAIFRQFAVPGIPDAIGFGGSGSGSAGINVAFAKGDYYYLVGEIVGSDISSVTAGAERTLIAAAQHLYRRVGP